MRNLWKKLHSRIIYQNPWITVIEDSVIRPDKKKGIYGFTKVSDSVVIVALSEKHKIASVRQFRYTLNTTTLELPWGGTNRNEASLHAAQRELREETGIAAKKWKYLGYLYDYPSLSTEKAHIYLATMITEGKPEPESVEVIQSIMVSFEMAMQWIAIGKIKDAVTIAALTKVKNYLRL